MRKDFNKERFKQMSVSRSRNMDEVLPNGERSIQFYPGTKPRWDYSRTQQVNKDIKANFEDPNKTAGILRDYIFDSHPWVLDLPPAISHRFSESMRVMESFPNGKENLESLITDYFKKAEERLLNGYAVVRDVDVLTRKDAEYENERIKIHLPESVKRRALVWNKWVQKMIKDGRIKEVFTPKPQGISVRLAEGSLLQAGNLMFEVAQGLGRLHKPEMNPSGLELKEMLATFNDGTQAIVETDHWFILSHIVEKDLLKLSQILGEGMIDGMKLTPRVYVKSYIPILELIEINPSLDIRGVLSEGTWIYSSELGKLFPEQDISKLHDVAGKVIDIGTAQELGLREQIDFATRDSVRRKSFEDGEYKVTIAARFIDPQEMRKAISEHAAT